MVAATATSPSTDPRNAGSPVHPSTPSPLPASSSARSTPSSAPLSPLDTALLTRLYETTSLPALFDSLSQRTITGAPTSLFALTQWANQDHIKPWIDIHATQIREAEQREVIALLKDIAKTSENPVERRRAASSILRALGLGAQRPPRSPSEPRPSGSGTRRTSIAPFITDNPFDSPSSPPHPLTSSPVHPSSTCPLPAPRGTPKLTPSPSLSIFEAAKAVGLALLNPDNPDDLATLETFLAPACTIESEPVTNLRSQVRALNRRGELRQLIGPYQKSDQLFNPAADFCTLKAVYTQKPHRTCLSFARSPTSPHPKSWLLTTIAHDTS